MSSLPHHVLWGRRQVSLFFCMCGEPWTPINQYKIIALQYFHQIFLTLILRDSRSCVTVPNCEKNCFIWGSKKPCGMLPTYTTPGVIISGFYQKKMSWISLQQLYSLHSLKLYFAQTFYNNKNFNFYFCFHKYL